MDINDEILDKTVEFFKDRAEEIAKPTAISIGKNIGLLVDGTIGWLGAWGETQKIRQEMYVKEFKNRLNTKISNIPENYLIEPKMKEIGPIIDASKYYYEDEYYVKMFSDLLQSSCDTRMLDRVHPAFVEFIKQLSPLDAKFLSCFNIKRTYPIAEVEEVFEDGKVALFYNTLFDFSKSNVSFTIPEQLKLTISLNNLIRLGLVVKNSNILELNYDYNIFKQHFLYKSYEKIKESPNTKLRINKYRLELTEMGRDFLACCLKDCDE